MVTPPSQFDELEAGILVHDSETGDILYANTYAETLYGYSKPDLMTMGVADFTSTGFSKSEALQRIQTAADGQSQQFEWRNKRPSGELYWVEVRLSPLTIDETTYVAAVVRDITEYKMNLRHLRVLTRITRHNLRNKLNVIEGFFNQINLEDTDRTIADRVRRNISELLDLTNWINTVKSLNSRDSTAEACDICELVTEICEPYQRKHQQIDWQFDCEQTYALVDPTLRTAIDELVSNAVQHNPHENLEINVAITECPADQQVRIQITDTGQPIPELEIEPLMSGYDPDPLNHGEQIGLWEVQTIINAHRGALLVPENNVNQKTVEIILPQKENNELDKQ